MYQHKPRRFKRRTDGRSRHPRGNGGLQVRLGSNSFSNNPTRNHFRTPLSAEKLFEKYNTLAKEALTSGDKILSENYYQHADHFIRIIDSKNLYQNQNKIQVGNKPVEPNKHTIESNEINKDQNTEKDKD